MRRRNAEEVGSTLPDQGSRKSNPFTPEGTGIPLKGKDF